MMNAESAEEIGNIIGQFVEADKGSNGNAIGNFLRIKIRMMINKPLMRGFTLDEEVDEGSRGSGRKQGEVAESMRGEGEGGWCRFEYEYLPDFCYTCGMIGHGEKDCKEKLMKGEAPQFAVGEKQIWGIGRQDQMRGFGAAQGVLVVEAIHLVITGRVIKREVAATVFLGGRVILGLVDELMAR